MPKMQFDKSFSLGNVISWAIMAVSLGIGYQKLVSSTEENSKSVIEARVVAAAAVTAVEKRAELNDGIRAADIKTIQTDVALLKTSVAVTAEKIENVNSKIGELSVKLDQLVARPSR